MSIAADYIRQRIQREQIAIATRDAFASPAHGGLIFDGGRLDFQNVMSAHVSKAFAKAWAKAIVDAIMKDVHIEIESVSTGRIAADYLRARARREKILGSFHVEEDAR